MITDFYKNKAQEIRIRFQNISQIIKHNWEKWAENEDLLIDFLKWFLPKSYSIWKGFIIDNKWNISNQCDIVIYDNFYNPNLITFGSNYYFPIESVYWVIEVKTKISKKDIKKSYNDFLKIKNLDFISENYSFLPDDLVWELSNSDWALWYTSETIRPFYFLFWYTSTYKQPWKACEWFKSEIVDDMFFSWAFIMDLWIIQYFEKDNKVNISVPKLFDNNWNIVELSKNSESKYYYNWIEYDTIKVLDKKYPIDYSRNIMFFLYFLDYQMKKRKVMWTKYLQSYLWPQNGVFNFQS